MPSACRTATAIPPTFVPGGMNWTVKSAGRPIPRKQPTVQIQPWSNRMYFHHPRNLRTFSAVGTKTLPVADSSTRRPPTTPGMKPTVAAMPMPLSRTQFVTVQLPRPPAPA